MNNKDIPMNEQIITHPGSAHTDDFLSCCLVIHRSGNIDTIFRKEPTPEEVDNTSLWKLDVGDVHDPERNCFDHHQNGIEDDCALSLLLKHWDLWEKAKEVHQWVEIAVIKDTRGSKGVTKALDISFSALGALDSFVERTILVMFSEASIIKRGEPIFTLMEKIGARFFTLIDLYYTLPAKVEQLIEFKEIKGVPTSFCYKGIQFSGTLLRVMKEQMMDVWPDLNGGIMVYPNKRVPGTIAMSRLKDDRRVDFSRIADYENVIFAHESGFFASVKPMSHYELEIYIKDAIRN